MKISDKELALATGATLADARKYVDHLNVAMARFQINTPRRVAAFLATVAIESDRLTAVEEGLYYKDAGRLAKIFPRAFQTVMEAAPYARNPKGLRDLLYKGYHGRGLIQVTWEDNYREASEDLGFDYVGNPDLLLQPQHAALTAAWYWSKYGCNKAADRGDMREVTRLVNGPARLHLAERTRQYVANIGWMITA
jgi:putative chitinase